MAMEVSRGRLPIEIFKVFKLLRLFITQALKSIHFNPSPKNISMHDGDPYDGTASIQR